MYCTKNVQKIYTLITFVCPFLYIVLSFCTVHVHYIDAN